MSAKGSGGGLKRAPRPLTLSRTLTLYAGGGLLLLAALLGLFIQQSIGRTLEQSLQDKASALARQLATVSLDAILVHDYGTLERYVADLARQEDVVYLAIRRRDGIVLAEAGQPTPGGAVVAVAEPLTLGANQIGEVILLHDRTAADHTARLLSLLWFGGVVAVTLLLFFILKQLLHRRLVRPVQQLAARVSPLPPEPAAPLDLRGMPLEVAQLAATFERLRQEIRDHIGDIEQANRLARTATERFCREQRLASIGQMAAGLAHGLNTPLGNIVGYAQQGSRTDDEAARRRFEVIERQARKCSEIVKDLLSAARAPRTVLQESDLAALTRSVITLVSPVLRDHGLERIDLIESGACPVRCDVSALEQVLFNLLTNAVQAGATRIEVRVTTKDSEALLEVTDNGPGVPESRQAQIFEPFFTTKQAGSGTGLGLYLCRTLLAAMEGTIALAESRPGLTRFRLTLPAETPEPNALTAEAQR